ncbi:hypothetical protein C8R47DRAFT_657556 [Mycena vitilis]|nr:hypothetical protein C8R47DRAFT_657556 [Mycena vitilis]
MYGGRSHAYASVKNAFSSSLLPDTSQEAKLSNHLRANTIPPEPSHFRSVVASSRSEIGRYDINIRNIQAALDKLVSERNLLEAHAARCRSLFAPIRSIPPEVLAQIFGYCDANFYSAEPRWEAINVVECLAKYDLLQLSRVCSMWHTVVMGTPSLWANLIVDIDLCDRGKTKAGLLLSAALERSSDCPLNLGLGMTRKYTDNEGLQLLAETSQRWRSVHLAAYSPDFQHFVSRKGKFPLLEALSIYGRSLDEHDIFNIAPRLVEVSLHLHGIDKPPRLPWTQLRVLHCKGITADELQAITDLVPRCPNLSTLNVECFGSSRSPPLPPINTNVDSFAIEMLNPFDWDECARVFSDLLRAFTLPCARAMSLGTNSKGRALFWSQDAFVSLISRSSSGDVITSLTLRNITIPESDLLECLVHLPRLESLFVTDAASVLSVNPPSPDHIVVTDTLLRALLWTPWSATCLLPNLQLFRCVSLFRFTPGVFLDFVRSREKARTAPLRRFELRIYATVPPPVPEDEFVAELRSMQRRGEIWFSLETAEAQFGDL